MEPLSPWQRAQTALAILAVDPAGIKGLWLRARAGGVRDRVTEGLAAIPLPLRRMHPGIDDTSLYGGVDLAATLASGHVVKSLGILGAPAALVLTMAERCPPGLAARLARVLDDPGSCLVALDEGAEPEEVLPSALTDRVGLFLDLSDLGWSDTGPIVLDLVRLATARSNLPNIATPYDAIETLTDRKSVV